MSASAALRNAPWDRVPAALPEKTAADALAGEPQRGTGSVVFDQVGKVYHSAAGPVEALQDISVAVPPGSIFGIIGRSGAGKSSLLRTVNRLESVSSGRVLVDGPIL